MNNVFSEVLLTDFLHTIILKRRRIWGMSWAVKKIEFFAVFYCKLANQINFLHIVFTTFDQTENYAMNIIILRKTLLWVHFALIKLPKFIHLATQGAVMKTIETTNFH